MADEEVLKLHKMKSKIEATVANLSGSTFNDVNLAGADFRDVNLSGAKLEDVNLSHLHIRDANLSHASISDSLLKGMTIDGIAVTELLAAYRAAPAT